MSLHALVIDDNQVNIQVIASLLEAEGITLTALLNPLEIEQTLHAIGQLDIVFLDLEMPGMNGYELLDILRQDYGVVDIPIVAYTVHVTEVAEARRVGFDGFLGKPLQMNRFSDQLHRILDGQPVWDN